MLAGRDTDMLVNFTIDGKLPFEDASNMALKRMYGFYDYDKAVRKFGSKLPTRQQLEELQNKCTWTWTGFGHKVTGPNGNSIFLPAAGYRYCDGDVSDVGTYGFCWSSTPSDSDSGAWSLGFGSSGVCMYNGYARCGGLSVRLVK